MRLKLPKPLHGWRAFAGEVGVIVLGVLIALAFNQLVDTLQWRQDVANATKSLNTELAEAKLNSLILIAGSACVESKLDRLEGVVDHGNVPADTDVKLFGLRTWSIDAWESATTSGAVAHMTSRMRDRYARYGTVRLLGGLHARAYEAASRLSTLDHHKTLTDISRDRLEVDLAQLRALNLVLSVGSQQFLAEAEPLGLKLTEENRAAIVQIEKQFRRCAAPRKT